MARDVDDVVDPAGDPVIAVAVATAAVTGEVFVGIGREIGFLETFVVAIDRTHLAGPGIGDHQIAFAGAFEHMTGGIDDLGLQPEEWASGRAGLQVGCARQRCNQNAAGLGLPPGVDDRAACVADDAVIPFPGLGIDRLADRTEQFQRLAAGSLHRFLARRHERADGSRRGIENIDLVLIDDIPEARDRGIGRHTFEHQGRRAVGERPIDDVTVPRHPADIGRAPVDIAIVIVEDVLMRHRGKDQIAARGMQHALGLAGRARCVEDEQWVFGLHLLGLAFGRDLGRFLMIPEVAPGNHVHLAAGALDHDHRRDGAWNLVGSLVGIDLQRHLLAGAQALVRRDQDPGVAALDAAGQRLR